MKAKDPAPAVPPVLGGNARARVAAQAGTPIQSPRCNVARLIVPGDHMPDLDVRQARGKRIPALGDRTTLPDALAAYLILYMLV